MTHEQHAKKFIRGLYLASVGYIGPEQDKAIDNFMRHMKEAVKADIRKELERGEMTNCIGHDNLESGL